MVTLQMDEIMNRLNIGQIKHININNMLDIVTSLSLLLLYIYTSAHTYLHAWQKLYILIFIIVLGY